MYNDVEILTLTMASAFMAGMFVLVQGALKNRTSPLAVGWSKTLGRLEAGLRRSQSGGGSVVGAVKLTEDEARACTDVEMAMLLIGPVSLVIDRHTVRIDLDVEGGPDEKVYPSIHAYLVEQGYPVPEETAQIVERLLREVGPYNCVHISDQGVSMGPARWESEVSVLRYSMDSMGARHEWCLAPCTEEALQPA